MSQLGRINGTASLFPWFDLPAEVPPPEVSPAPPPAVPAVALQDPTPITQDPQELEGDWSGRELGATLSPSQVNSFVDCAAKWYFKNIRELPDPPSGALALGTSFHEAVRANFNYKKAKGEDLPLGDVLEAFRNAWGDVSRAAVFTDDEDPGAMGRTGEALVTKYITDAAPAIHPALVEHKVDPRASDPRNCCYGARWGPPPGRGDPGRRRHLAPAKGMPRQIPATLRDGLGLRGEGSRAAAPGRAPGARKR